MRRLVALHETLRPVVHDVDKRRIAYLKELHERAGLSTEDAHVIAELEYAAYVGFQHMADGRDAAELPVLYARLEEMVARLASTTTC